MFINACMSAYLQKLVKAPQLSISQDTALLWLACNYQSCCIAMRTLAGLLAASRSEDALGIVQQTQPTLGTVCLCVCVCVGGLAGGVKGQRRGTGGAQWGLWAGADWG